jgi:PAS domain S-box-containing protein
MIDHTLSQLVNLEQVRQLLESHNRLSEMAYGLFDADENNLIAVGWQDICVRFHRANPVTSAYCRESDAFIKAHLHDNKGEPLEYRCKNNMIDIAMPIVIDGRHLGTFFTGQFFYDDNPPDRDFFIMQAGALGFDTEEYLKALDRVPRFSREHIRSNVLFLHNMVQVLVESGLKNLRLASEMEERKLAEEGLRESEQRFHQMFDHHSAVMLLLDPGSGAIVDANQAAADFYGYSHDTLCHMFIHDINDLPPDQVAMALQKVENDQQNYFIFPHRLANGEIRTVEVRSSVINVSRGSLLFSIIHDVTESKRTEEARNRLNEELEQRVKERTAELMAKNEELARMNKIFVGRELRMVELKERIKELEHVQETATSA